MQEMKSDKKEDQLHSLFEYLCPHVLQEVGYTTGEVGFHMRLQGTDNVGKRSKANVGNLKWNSRSVVLLSEKKKKKNLLVIVQVVSRWEGGTAGWYWLAWRDRKVGQ